MVTFLFNMYQKFEFAFVFKTCCTTSIMRPYCRMLMQFDQLSPGRHPTHGISFSTGKITAISQTFLNPHRFVG